MDKKVKKKVELVRGKIRNLEQRLAGARKQQDDPNEVARLQADLASARSELEQLLRG